MSIVDRLSQLQTAQKGWQRRVGEKDNDRFTVAGKMGRDNKEPPGTPAKTSAEDGAEAEAEEAVARRRTPRTPRMRTVVGRSASESAAAEEEEAAAQVA